MTVPTGNGESRDPMAAAGAKPTNLPGTRPERARRNDAAFPSGACTGDPKDQAGFGNENMMGDTSFVNSPTVAWYDTKMGGPVDLMSMGDPGESFGGS